MTNHRLRGAMLNIGLTSAGLAEALEVDAKSVGRWVAGERMPYPITRVKIAQILGQEETYLWPSLVDEPAADQPPGADGEIGRVWPARRTISNETWHALFSRVSAELDILVYSGAFLIESLDLADVLAWKASRGTRVRVLVGDPGSDAVRSRAVELSIDWLPQRCRTTLDYLRRVPAIQVRPHPATHYVSLFRFDDIMLANTHAYGIWACHSPVVQLQKSRSDELFRFYATSFEKVWTATIQSNRPGRAHGTPVTPQPA